MKLISIDYIDTVSLYKYKLLKNLYNYIILWSIVLYTSAVAIPKNVDTVLLDITDGLNLAFQQSS